MNISIAGPVSDRRLRVSSVRGAKRSSASFGCAVRSAMRRQPGVAGGTCVQRRHPDVGFVRAGLGLLVVVLLAGGCAASPRVTHLYEGEERPEEELAMLEYAYPLEIISIDGEGLNRKRLHPVSKPRRLYLDPGVYRIMARHGAIYLVDEEDPTVVRPGPVLIETELEAGARYRLVHKIGPRHKGVDIRVEEVD